MIVTRTRTRTRANATAAGPMRSFDPHAVGTYECRAWETYYRRRWAAFLVASVGMVRAAFRMSWRRTLVGAWLVLVLLSCGAIEVVLQSTGRDGRVGAHDDDLVGSHAEVAEVEPRLAARRHRDLPHAARCRSPTRRVREELHRRPTGTRIEDADRGHALGRRP